MHEIMSRDSVGYLPIEIEANEGLMPETDAVGTGIGIVAGQLGTFSARRSIAELEGEAYMPEMQAGKAATRELKSSTA